MARPAIGVLATGLLATAAFAHHGFGTFAMNEDIELSGVITDLDFVNPHSWLHFDVTTDSGEKISYRCELRSATTLRRSGWTPEMFAPGTRITVQGSPDRYDKRACYVSTLIFADGTQLDRYGQRIEAKASVDGRPLRLPNGQPNISGDWAAEQLVMTDPQGRDGTLVPLSQAPSFAPGAVPEGQREIPGARGTREAAEGRDPFARPPARAVVGLTAAGQAAREELAAVPRAVRSCTPGSIVSDWGGEPVNRITQTDATVTLQYGRFGLERTIHLNRAAHPSDIEPSRAGHSIGRWENDVLVVDTVGFLPGTLTGTTPHSSELHVVERFWLDTETMALKREYVAEDPLYFMEPYTGSNTSYLSPVPYSPEPCADLTPVPTRPSP
ncbi:MAG TPA: DUF6152 family protein [Gammaproteobacteria bacterium]